MRIMAASQGPLRGVQGGAGGSHYAGSPAAALSRLRAWGRNAFQVLSPCVRGSRHYMQLDLIPTGLSPEVAE